MTAMKDAPSLESLVRARNLFWAVAPMILIIGVAALTFASAVLRSGLLYDLSIPFFVVGLLLIMVLFGVLMARIDKAKEGRWSRDDYPSLIKMMSLTYPVGFVISMLLVILMPIGGVFPSLRYIITSALLLSLMGFLLWAALMFTFRDMTKDGIAIERTFEMPIEEVYGRLSAAGIRLPGTEAEMKRSPFTRKILTVQMQTLEGKIKLRRYRKKVTRAGLLGVKDWKKLATAVDGLLL